MLDITENKRKKMPLRGMKKFGAQIKNKYSIWTRNFRKNSELLLREETLFYLEEILTMYTSTLWKLFFK